jgi:hypothetical protein
MVVGDLHLDADDARADRRFDRLGSEFVETRLNIRGG